MMQRYERNMKKWEVWHMRKIITVQNLLTVKSIVTILLTAIFAYLAVVGRISGEQFLTVYSVIVPEGEG